MIKAKIHLGNKANDTTKNNEPKEYTKLKLLLKKTMIDSIKNANVPSIIEPSIQPFGILGCEITLLFNVGNYNLVKLQFCLIHHIWMNLMCIS